MREKKEKKKWGLILFIVFIMIGTSVSFVFFGFSGVEEKVKYNGITFTRFPDRWEARINGANAAFSFLPGEAEAIPSSGDFAKALQGKFEIDITYDLNSTYVQSIALAQYQMGLTLNAYNIYAREGFTSNNTFNIPVIKCSDATPNVPVVYFRHGNSTSIHVDSDCVIAEASSNADFIKAKDRILYGILGVME